MVIGTSLEMQPINNLPIKIRSNAPILILNNFLPKMFIQNKKKYADRYYHMAGDLQKNADEIFKILNSL